MDWFTLQEIVLGISSFSALGPIGAAFEVTIIMYPFAKNIGGNLVKEQLIQHLQTTVILNVHCLLVN